MKVVPWVRKKAASWRARKEESAFRLRKRSDIQSSLSSVRQLGSQSGRVAHRW